MSAYVNSTSLFSHNELEPFYEQIFVCVFRISEGRLSMGRAGEHLFSGAARPVSTSSLGVGANALAP